MTAKANSVAIQITSSGTLTVTDCANTPGKITRASGATGRGVDNAGTFNLYNGEISRYEATGSNQSNDSWGVVTGRTFNGKVLNEGTIKGGTFNGTVTNNYDVNDGTFSGTVINNAYGYINGGTFNGAVNNQKYGEIYGGTFSGTMTNEKNGVIHDSAYRTVTFHTASTTT